MSVSAQDFSLPEELVARRPPEARGTVRGSVRLLIARPAGLEHARFGDIVDALRPGDVVVVNTSATLPAAVDGVYADGSEAVVHFSSRMPDGSYIVELRSDGGPRRDVATGERIRLPGGVFADMLVPHPDRNFSGSRLWRARVAVEGSIKDYLFTFGRPISYGYLDGPLPLADYQTIFSRHPGSAEMPSAARPFTHELVTELIAAGINLAPVVLHCGVSSSEMGEVPPDERFDVPASTAWLVNEARRRGGRVLAVGTSVTRALESAASPDGVVSAARGCTHLVLGPERPARVVDALLTGFHEPKSSHLLLLQAVAGTDLVNRAYETALQSRYLWHEFGDACLFMPRAEGRGDRIAVPPRGVS